VISSFTVLSVSIPAAALDVGQHAPAFANLQIDGAYMLSKDLIGKHWLLLAFFATDCEPCVKELEDLQKLMDDFAAKDFTILVVATDPQGTSLVKPFVESRSIRLPVVIDRYRVTTERYGVDKIPSAFLIDPDGFVAFKAESYSEETIATIRSLLMAELFR
jgi:peroxiredoxin